METRMGASSLRQRRRELLEWASAVSGLPLTHVSEVQNGAVFCYIISLICDLDLSLVNYDAQEECECLANFRLIQTVAKAGRVRGLNHTAKLSHWGRLAVCESDAWEFLAVLNRSLTRAGKGYLCTKIEADATPPPPPLNSRKGQKKRSASPFNSPSYASQKHRSLKPSSSKAKRRIDDDISKLAEGLLSSQLSDMEPFISAAIRTGAIEAHETCDDSAWQGSESSHHYERNLSGASTVAGRDSSPASPSSSFSEQLPFGGSMKPFGAPCMPVDIR